MPGFRRPRTSREGFASCNYPTDEDADHGVAEWAALGWYVIERRVHHRIIYANGKPFSGESPICITIRYRRGPKPPPPLKRGERPVFGEPTWIERAKPKQRTRKDATWDEVERWRKH